MKPSDTNKKLQSVINVLQQEIDDQIIMNENLRFRDIMLEQIETLRSLMV